MLALIDRLANHGELHNQGKFRFLRKNLWELKIFKYRILCFRDGDSWVLTHGFQKKSDATPPGQIDRGERIRREDLARNV